MARQPSTLGKLTDTANTAYSTVAQSLTSNTTPPDDDTSQDPSHFTQDRHGNTVKKGHLKHKLNEAALGTGGEKEEVEGVVEKVLSYIPGMGSKEEEEGKEGEVVRGNEGPPNRPEHDVQVEQFLRGQYHSRSGDGMPKPDEGK